MSPLKGKAEESLMIKGAYFTCTCQMPDTWPHHCLMPTLTGFLIQGLKDSDDLRECPGMIRNLTTIEQNSDRGTWGRRIIMGGGKRERPSVFFFHEDKVGMAKDSPKVKDVKCEHREGTLLLLRDENLFLSYLTADMVQ